MSLRRFVISAVLAGAGMFAVNAIADTTTAAPASSASAPAAATTTAPAPMTVHHAKAKVVAKVDINSADAATLAKVKGLGMKKAKAIIDYRTKNGSFKSLDDLKSITNAKGKPMFTDKTLAHLKNRLMVGASS